MPLLLSLGHSCAAAAPAPVWVAPAVRACVRLQPGRAFLVLPPRMSRSEQLRQVAVQLASLASLEDVVTHGVRSLLESPPGLVAPTTADELAAPLPYPRRPRTAAGRFWSASAAPISLAVRSCPPTPPERSSSSHHRSDTLAPCSLS